MLGSMASRAGPYYHVTCRLYYHARPHNSQMAKEDYAKKAYQWAKAFKLLDPSITLILCGETGHSAWDYYVLKECLKFDQVRVFHSPSPQRVTQLGTQLQTYTHSMLMPEQHALGGNTGTASLIDMHSIHIYTASSDKLQNPFAPRSAERAIEICASLIDLARISNGVPPTISRQTICFDEWNVWDPRRAPGEAGAEEKYTLSDALAVAIWLNVFVRQSKYVAMANLAQSVNVISPLMTTETGLVKQTTWWPLLLFSKFMRGWNVASHVSCGIYEGETEPAWLRSAGETPWLDVSATLGEDGWVSVVVVNVHPTQSASVELDGLAGGGDEVRVYTVAADDSDKPDAPWDATNTAEKQMVGIKESVWKKQSGKFEFPKYSITMMRWKV